MVYGGGQLKKIALISDGWRRMITYAWVDGIIRRIRELDEDIALYQYNCYGNWSKDALHNTGEYNIYNLPDLSAFDGIILDGSNIVDVRQKEKIVERLQNCGVPVLSLDWYISGFYYVGADNRMRVSVAIAKFIPSLLLRATSISESGFSMSWNIQGIKDYYTVLCREYDLPNALGNRIKVLDIADYL